MLDPDRVLYTITTEETPSTSLLTRLLFGFSAIVRRAQISWKKPCERFGKPVAGVRALKPRRGQNQVTWWQANVC